MALFWPYRVTVVVKGKITLNFTVEVMRTAGVRTLADVKQAAVRRVSSYWEFYHKTELVDSDIRVIKITSDYNTNHVYWEATQEDVSHVH